MLSKGLKDEENQKINELVGRLIDLEFVPEYYETEQRSKVNGLLLEHLNFQISDLESFTTEGLLLKLKDLHFDFSNLEHFGDFILKILPFEKEENKSHFVVLAVAILEYIQLESKTLSFSTIQKINQARDLV